MRRRYRPFYKRALFWIPVALVVAAAVTALIIYLVNRKDVIERQERSQTYWENYVFRDDYAEPIRDILENTDHYNIGKATWEFSTVDVDLDGTKELFLRINDGEAERAHTFVFRLDGKYAYLAGTFEGASYPVFSPACKAFEAPSSDLSGKEHVFYMMKGNKCVKAYTLSEKDGGYSVDGKPITYEEYAEYFEDAVFLDWTKFTGSFAYSKNDGIMALEDFEPVGEVPEKFKKIVDEDLFGSAVLSENILYSTTHENNIYTIVRYDIFGELLPETRIEHDLGSVPSSFQTTPDGGFAYWESCVQGEDELVDHIVKCDKNGREEWRWIPSSENSGASLICVGVDGAVYVAGTEATSDQNYDVLIVELNERGEEIVTKTLSGSGADYPSYVYTEDGKILLGVISSSHDGDYSIRKDLSPATGFYEFELNNDLDVISSTRTEDYEYFEYLGTVDGKKITTLDPFAKKFKDGRLSKIIDYGSTYLTASHIGVSSLSSIFSSTLSYYGATVYGMYGKSGEVIWKAISNKNAEPLRLDG